MTPLEQRLRNETTAEIRFDALSRQIWSSDASIFRLEPLGVVLPKTQEDLQQICKIAGELSIPLIARGAATGISGGCLGNGLIVDVSKYLIQIIDINLEEEWALVEPGVILDDLNHALSTTSFRIGPETSTGNRATLGGMTANNSSGARSLRYGKMVDHVTEIEMIIAGGEKLVLKQVSEVQWEATLRQESSLGKIVRIIEHIREELSEEIISRFPKLDRRVSGYNLDTLAFNKKTTLTPPNLAKLIVGSEGSLGIVSKIKIKLSKKPQFTGLSIIHFHDLDQAFSYLPSMINFEPLALELLDDHILNLAKKIPRMKEKLSWVMGEPAALIIAEFEAHSLHEVKLKLLAFEADMRHHGIGYAYTQVMSPEQMQEVWEVRKAGLGLLMSKRSYTNAVAFLEDMALPPHTLPGFMKEFRALLKKHDKEAGIYGHVGAGCMHIRPYLNLRDKNDVDLISHLMDEVSSLLLIYQGTLSGEHGDGLIRSYLNEKMFGTKIYQAFKEIKGAFDPHNLMNPGKVVDGPSFDSLKKDLKMGPSTVVPNVKTFLNFEKEGGFALSVDLCNGNGQCRKKEGVMCPSFQATNDEYDSTRARANALQGLIHAGATQPKWNDKGVHDVLDLCLQCKGCKTECPSSVDMAKMKTEFLYQYQKETGVSFRSGLFSALPRFLRWGSFVPSLMNKILEKSWFRSLQKKFGIAPERSFPLFASERFSKWYDKNVKGKQLKGKRVVLFNDTYNEFINPEIGKSAVTILQALGYEVICPQWHCCGRPEISKGLLEEARRMAVKLIKVLAPYAKSQIPIIGLEPSCILTLLDEYRDFPELDAKDVIDHCYTFDEFLADHLENGKLPLPFKNTSRDVKVHGHCYQKALVGMAPTLDVLRGVSGFNVEEIPSGCCGMAGSFGYESEHYDLSMKIGELKLLPTVREASKDTLIIASGLSCRTQIADGAGRSAIHLAEAIVRQMEDKP